MPPDARLPRGGFSTMSAKITRDRIRKIEGLVAKLKAKGHSDAQVLRAMTENLPDIDAFSIRGLLARCSGATLVDDFTPENVERVVELKLDRIDVSVRTLLPDARTGSLVRYRNRDWIVLRLLGATYELKSV
jgi:hypothetical protein